jgi:hypothetical protein
VSDFDLESVTIYRCVVGSRAYGLDTDESDTDRHLPSRTPPQFPPFRSAHYARLRSGDRIEEGIYTSDITRLLIPGESAVRFGFLTVETAKEKPPNCQPTVQKRFIYGKVSNNKIRFDLFLFSVNYGLRDGGH